MADRFLTDDDKKAILESRLRQLEAERFQHQLNVERANALPAEFAADAAETIADAERNIGIITAAIDADAAAYDTLAG